MRSTQPQPLELQIQFPSLPFSCPHISICQAPSLPTLPSKRLESRRWDGMAEPVRAGAEDILEQTESGRASELSADDACCFPGPEHGESDSQPLVSRNICVSSLKGTLESHTARKNPASFRRACVSLSEENGQWQWTGMPGGPCYLGVMCWRTS